MEREWSWLPKPGSSLLDPDPGFCVAMTWRRPTLPRLRTQYHRRSRVFTAEFGMGSGVWPLAMTTRSSQHRSQKSDR